MGKYLENDIQIYQTLCIYSIPYTNYINVASHPDFKLISKTLSDDVVKLVGRGLVKYNGNDKWHLKNVKNIQGTLLREIDCSIQFDLTALAHYAVKFYVYRAAYLNSYILDKDICSHALTLEDIISPQQVNTNVNVYNTFYMAL